MKSVLVTGAASGIGRALAERYAAHGNRLLLVDRRSDDTLAAHLTATGATDVAFGAVDVTDAAAVASTFDELADGLPIDLVVNCAGVLGQPAGLAEMDAREISQVVNVNLVGSLNVAQAALPHLRAGSHLAFIASMGGLVAGYHYTAYSSSKFGVVGLAEALRMELAPRGVVVQVVCPGEVTTPMVDAEIAGGDEVLRSIKLMSGRPITATEAARRIEAGLERRTFMVIPGLRARTLWWTTRFSPVPVRHRVTDLLIQRATRKAGDHQ